MEPGKPASSDSIPVCLASGDSCYAKGDYTLALEFYVKGLRLCELSGTDSHTGRFYKNIGNIYCLFEDYERGKMYYKEGLEHSRACGDKETEMKLLINLTGIHMFIDKADEARTYFKEMGRVGFKGDDTMRFMTRFNLGLIQIADSNYAAAAANYRTLASTAVNKGLSPKYLCSAYQQTYKAYLGLGRRDSALYYMKECERRAADSGIMHMFVDLLKDMSDFYEKSGDTQSSLRYKARYLAFKDSIYDMRQFDAVKHAQFLYEMDKVDKEISKLNTEKEEYRRVISWQRAMITVSLLAAIVVSVFLLIIYRQKKKLDVSYASLYSINRKFAENCEEQRRRIHGYMEQIKAKEEEIRRLGGDTVDAIQPQESAKYSMSSLNDKQKMALAEAIMGVMENDREFCSDDFSLDKLAKLVGSNSKYVSQVINDMYNKNFSNFVNEYRINLACIRLSDFKAYGNYTIRAVAESTGFKSYSTFNSVFRKITGITPSLYQKMAKEEASMSKMASIS